MNNVSVSKSETSLKEQQRLSNRGLQRRGAEIPGGDQALGMALCEGDLLEVALADDVDVLVECIGGTDFARMLVTAVPWKNSSAKLTSPDSMRSSPRT